MKKLWFLVPLVMLFFACGSPPAPAPEAAPAPSAAGDVQQERAKASDARQKAESVKADKVAQVEYMSALGSYSGAEALAATGDPGAAAAYQEATKLFTTAYNVAVGKRDEAQKQINAAKASIKDVEDLSQQGGGR